MPKFADFATALAALCRKHGVSLGSVQPGSIGVGNLKDGDDPLARANLIDHTQGAKPTKEKTQKDPLPYYFQTHIEARKHPGYIGYEVGRSAAFELSQKHAGSQIVPIGSGARVRGYVVVMPQ